MQDADATPPFESVANTAVALLKSDSEPSKKTVLGVETAELIVPGFERYMAYNVTRMCCFR
jgi:hypothetical protein